MAGLINTKRDETPSGRLGSKSLFVLGIRHTNAAAKFWPSLFDEVREDFPGCSLIELSAPLSVRLTREYLFPSLSLERNMQELLSRDLSALMRETMAELELIGPPVPVRIRLLSGDSEILSKELPLDSIDAEIFPYLVVWLLEWAGIPDSLWNGRSMKGVVNAEDRKRSRRYSISFDVTNTDMSEGLYRQTVTISRRLEEEGSR